MECALGKKFKAKKEATHEAATDAAAQQTLREQQSASELRQ